MPKLICQQCLVLVERIKKMYAQRGQRDKMEHRMQLPKIGTMLLGQDHVMGDLDLIYRSPFRLLVRYDTNNSIVCDHKGEHKKQYNSNS